MMKNYNNDEAAGSYWLKPILVHISITALWWDLTWFVFPQLHALVHYFPKIYFCELDWIAFTGNTQADIFQPADLSHPLFRPECCRYPSSTSKSSIYRNLNWILELLWDVFAWNPKPYCFSLIWNLQSPTPVVCLFLLFTFSWTPVNSLWRKKNK